MSDTIPVAVKIDYVSSSSPTVDGGARGGNCRRCGKQFIRPFGSRPTCDEYFRCSSCRGLHIEDFCTIQ